MHDNERDINDATIYQTVRDKSSNAGRRYDFAPAEDDTVGVLRERYRNIARSPTTYTVHDFEIVEDETEFGSEHARVEDLDEFRTEVREFVERVLFDSNTPAFCETTLTIPRDNHIKIEEHTDGDVITVLLDVASEDDPVREDGESE